MKEEGGRGAGREREKRSARSSALIKKLGSEALTESNYISDNMLTHTHAQSERERSVTDRQRHWGRNGENKERMKTRSEGS